MMERKELIDLIRKEVKYDQAELGYVFMNYSRSDKVILIDDLEDILNKLEEE